MNYFNPYYYAVPTNLGFSSGLSSIFKHNFNFSSILDGTQRALSLFNQALPLIKEAAPMMRNAKTMFKVMNEFKKVDSLNSSSVIKTNTNLNQSNYNETYLYNNGGPTFFA